MSLLSKAGSYLPGGSGFGSLWDKTAGKVWNDFTGKSAVDEQNENAWAMWNAQNQYNTPANQVARYRDAGLNPNLIYGNGSSSAGNASSMPDLVAHQGSAGKLIGLLSTVIGLKGQLEGQSLEKAKTLSSIEHSKDLLEFEKRKALVDEAFRNAELRLKEDDLGFRRTWKDREYRLAKDRLDFERSKPYGGTIGFMDRVIQGVTGQSTSDVASDVGSGLQNFFASGFDNMLRYDWRKGAGNVVPWVLRLLHGIKY